MSTAPLMMSFFITFREGFEAMLIVMLIFTYLKRFHAQGKEKWVWFGIISGILSSIAIAVGVKYIAGITHEHEVWFEGITMGLASLVLVYLAFWCHGAKNHFDEDIVDKLKPLDERISMWSSLALMFAVMFAILREGFEIVLFYSALLSSAIADKESIVLGAGIGIISLLAVYIVMRQATNKIPTKHIFEGSKYFFVALALWFGINAGIELNSAWSLL